MRCVVVVTSCRAFNTAAMNDQNISSSMITHLAKCIAFNFFPDAGMKSNFSLIHNLAIKLGISKAYAFNITIQLGKRQIIRSLETLRRDCTGKHTCTAHALCDCVHVITCICL